MQRLAVKSVVGTYCSIYRMPGSHEMGIITCTMARTKNNKTGLPKVNSELEGFNVKVGSFGELQTSYNIEDINSFLNKRLADKKLVDRDDYEKLKKD